MPMETEMDRVLLGRTKDMKELSVSTTFLQLIGFFVLFGILKKELVLCSGKTTHSIT